MKIYEYNIYEEEYNVYEDIWTFASWVLPTPVGPRNMKLAVGHISPRLQRRLESYISTKLESYITKKTTKYTTGP